MKAAGISITCERSEKLLNARSVYAAIADPTRREILDLLRDRGMQSAGDIAANFNSISRPGISRHLRVLRESGVVVSIRDGKTQNYLLDPAPLQAIREGWLAEFSHIQTASLVALRRQIEEKRD